MASDAHLAHARQLLQTHDFDVLGLFGRGGFGNVYHARCLKSGAHVAVKALSKLEAKRLGMASRVISEVSLHSQLGHPHIVKLLDFFEDLECVYLVMEACNAGDVYRLVKIQGGLEANAARFLSRQLFSALHYLHALGVLHRDLKLSNLLLSDTQSIDSDATQGGHQKDAWYASYTLRLCDFGLAVQVAAGESSADDVEHRTVCGTPAYIAPEVATAAEPHSSAADIYSAGCLLFSMLVGTPPSVRAEQAGSRDVYRTRLTPDYATQLSGIDLHAADLIRWCMEQAPADRPTAAEVLQHSFFSRSEPSASLSVPVPAYLTPMNRTLADDVGGGRAGQHHAPHVNLTSSTTQQLPLISPVRIGHNAEVVSAPLRSEREGEQCDQTSERMSMSTRSILAGSLMLADMTVLPSAPVASASTPAALPTLAKQVYNLPELPSFVMPRVRTPPPGTKDEEEDCVIAAPSQPHPREYEALVRAREPSPLSFSDTFLGPSTLPPLSARSPRRAFPQAQGELLAPESDEEVVARGTQYDPQRYTSRPTEQPVPAATRARGSNNVSLIPDYDAADGGVDRSCWEYTGGPMLLDITQMSPAAPGTLVTAMEPTPGALGSDAPARPRPLGLVAPPPPTQRGRRRSYGSTTALFLSLGIPRVRTPSPLSSTSSDESEAAHAGRRRVSFRLQQYKRGVLKKKEEEENVLRERVCIYPTHNAQAMAWHDHSPSGRAMGRSKATDETRVSTSMASAAPPATGQVGAQGDGGPARHSEAPSAAPSTGHPSPQQQSPAQPTAVAPAPLPPMHARARDPLDQAALQFARIDAELRMQHNAAVEDARAAAQACKARVEAVNAAVRVFHLGDDAGAADVLGVYDESAMSSSLLTPRARAGARQPREHGLVPAPGLLEVNKDQGRIGSMTGSVDGTVAFPRSASSASSVPALTRMSVRIRLCAGDDGNGDRDGGQDGGSSVVSGLLPVHSAMDASATASASSAASGCKGRGGRSTRTRAKGTATLQPLDTARLLLPVTARCDDDAKTVVKLNANGVVLATSIDSDGHRISTQFSVDGTVQCTRGGDTSSLQVPVQALRAPYRRLYRCSAAVVRYLRSRTPRVAILAADCTALLMEDGPLPTFELVAYCSAVGGKDGRGAQGLASLRRPAACHAAWRVRYTLRDHRLIITDPSGVAFAAYILPPAYVREGGAGQEDKCLPTSVGAKVGNASLGASTSTLRVVHADELPAHVLALFSLAMRALARCLALQAKAEAQAEAQHTQACRQQAGTSIIATELPSFLSDDTYLTSVSRRRPFPPGHSPYETGARKGNRSDTGDGKAEEVEAVREAFPLVWAESGRWLDDGTVRALVRATDRNASPNVSPTPGGLQAESHAASKASPQQPPEPVPAEVVQANARRASVAATRNAKMTAHGEQDACVAVTCAHAAPVAEGGGLMVSYADGAQLHIEAGGTRVRLSQVAPPPSTHDVPERREGQWDGAQSISGLSVISHHSTVSGLRLGSAPLELGHGMHSRRQSSVWDLPQNTDGASAGASVSAHGQEGQVAAGQGAHKLPQAVRSRLAAARAFLRSLSSGVSTVES